jgi:hypothetical protein
MSSSLSLSLSLCLFLLFSLCVSFFSLSAAVWLSRSLLPSLDLCVRFVYLVCFSLFLFLSSSICCSRVCSSPSLSHSLALALTVLLLPSQLTLPFLSSPPSTTRVLSASARGSLFVFVFCCPNKPESNKFSHWSRIKNLHRSHPGTVSLRLPRGGIEMIMIESRN